MTSISTASSSAEAPPARRTPRAALRLAGLAGWTAVASLGASACLLVPWPGPRGRLRRAVFRTWSRGVCRLLRVEVAVQGVVPRPPFFLVSNHLSYLDIVVFAAHAPARFVAKREVRGWPGIGFLAGTMGTIFIDRAVRRDALRVTDQLAAAMRAGEGVVLFAEATSSGGRSVLPFRSALLDWAARAGCPVHYAAISYRTPPGAPPARESVCWWGDMDFGPHLRALAGLPAIAATLRFGGEPINHHDRKRLASELHEAVRAQFIPVVAE